MTSTEAAPFEEPMTSWCLINGSTRTTNWHELKQRNPYQEKGVRFFYKSIHLCGEQINGNRINKLKVHKHKIKNIIKTKDLGKSNKILVRLVPFRVALYRCIPYQLVILPAIQI